MDSEEAVDDQLKLYLDKAEELENRAFDCDSEDLRQTYLALAQGYRLLAQHSPQLQAG
jgi:hypothetical protein